MNGYKTDAVKQKLQNVEGQMEDNLNRVKSSHFARSIPTNLENVTFFDLLKCSWVFTIILDFAVLLVLDARTAGESKKLFSTFFVMMKIGFMFTGMLADFFGALIFMTGVFGIFKIATLIKIIKAVTVLITLVLSSSGMFMRLFSGAFGVLVIAADFIFIYYLSVYLDRVASASYDEYGMPIKV